MRYLVTGGAGFIGNALVRRLLRDGHQVVVLDDLSTGRVENLDGVDVVEMRVTSVTNEKDVGEVAKHVDGAFHLAAVASVQKSLDEPVRCHEVNVTGTLNLLQAMRLARGKRVVLSSSAAVYGEAADFPLSEKAAGAPISPYGLHKLIGEQYCRLYARSGWTEAVALRYFNVYGPRQDPNGEYAAVVPKFITRVAGGLPPVIFGDGKQTRDFLFVEDVVEANIAAMQAPGVSGTVFNVASGVETSLLDLVDALSEATGRKITPEFRAARTGDVLRSVGDGALAARVLGFKPKVTLAEGIRKTLGHFAPLPNPLTRAPSPRIKSGSKEST